MNGESVPFHPLDCESGRWPFDALRDLQSHCPVTRLDRPGMEPCALVTRHHDAGEVYRHASRTGERHGVDETFGEEDQTMLRLSGPKHLQVRRLAMASVRPRAVKEATPYLEAIAKRVGDELPDSGAIELRSQWASKIPSRVICHILGVPADDHDQFLAWTTSKIEALTRLSQGESIDEHHREAEHDFRAYMQGQIDARRVDSPPNDAISRMMFANEGDERLSDQEVIVNAIFLLNAGNQTTQNLLTSLLFSLLREEGLYERVRADRTLVPKAIEETLRLWPPIMYVTRVLDEPLTVSAMTLQTDEKVIISNAAANRDPAVWPEPDRFNLDRTETSRHLAFASGPHACFGAALARHIAEHAINALLDRYPDLVLAKDFTWQRQDYWTSLGMKRLDVIAH